MSIVTDYLAIWNDTDPATRRAAIDKVFAPTVSYTDPLVAVTSADDLHATIGAVQAQFPGLVFSQVGEVDAHHHLVRFRWGLGPAGADPIVIGFDVAALDPDGRISTVHGFLDQVPAGL